MQYIHLYTLFLLFVFHTSCGQSQTNSPQDNISKGLYSESQVKEAATSRVPMSMVRNVKKARNGDILIASYLGVFRYDAGLPDGQGTSFANLTSKISSPRFSTFWDVLEDRKGNLWFGTRDSDVYHYNARLPARAGSDGNDGAGRGKSLPTGQAGFQHFAAREGPANNAVWFIYEDRAGIIWFAGGGLTRYDGKSLPTGQAGFQNFTAKDGLPNNGVHTIMEDKTGKLWIGSSGELRFYDGKKFPTLTNKDGKTFKNVRGIIEDKKGNIWTTGEVNPKVWALSRYDARSLYNKMPTVTEIKSGGRMSFLCILEANDGSIWFGSGGGVHLYDGKPFTDFKSKKGQQ
jgi:ligand-binding sensor domain-containing protein